MEPLAVLSGLSYRELQLACKSVGVGARGTKEELVARLLEHNWQPSAETASPKGQSQVPALGATPAAGKTPANSKRTAVRAVAVTAAATAAALEEAAAPAPEAHMQAASPTPAAAAPTPRQLRSSRKPQAAPTVQQAPAVEQEVQATTEQPSARKQLVQAAATPLPKNPPAEEEQEEQAAEKAPQPAPAAAAPQQAARWAGPPRKGKCQQSPLGRVLLLAALCATLAAVAAPALGHNLDAGALLRQHLPGPMQQAEQLAGAALQRLGQGQEVLLQRWEGARVWGASHWSAVQQWAAANLQRAKSQAAAAQPELASCMLNTAALDNIVPATEAWVGLKQAVAEVWQRKRDSLSQAPSMLFTCAEPSCGAINDWLAWAAPEGCMLKVEASQLLEDPTALQSTLTAFLAQQPRATVLIANAQQLTPALVPLLGSVLPGTQGATLLLSWEVPREVLEGANEGDLRARMGAHLGQHVLDLVDYVVPTLH